MTENSLINADATSRELVRSMRRGVNGCETFMPESLAWHTFLELDKRGFPDAAQLFISALKTLHSRRSMAGSELTVTDSMSDEHRLTDDDLLAELWKAYKKCIRHNRTGPAFQLLREIEERVET